MMIPNLLITDDDTAFRKAICESMVRRGFLVTEASDGQEALDVLGQTEIHVALVDVHMPRVDGLQVMRHLVQKPNSPPCVLMSAQLNEEIERRRAALVEADREVRVLEKLRERKWSEHQTAELRHELRQLDEVAVQRWQRED